MDEVELVEDDWVTGREPAPAVRPPRGPLPWRRIARRWWPAPVVLAAVLVLADLGTGSVEQRDYQRLQAVPGVIRPIGPDVRVGGPGPRLTTLDPGQEVGGVLISRLWDASGIGVFVTGTDPETGDQLWRTDLPLGTPHSGEFAQAECWGDRGELVCWGSLAHQDPDNWWLRWGRTTLLRIDPATGEIRAATPLAPGSAAAGADGLLVTATDQGDGLTVEATGPGGTELWSVSVEPWDLPDITATDRLAVTVGAELIAVSAPDGTWLIDRTDGREVGQGARPLPTRAGGFWLQRAGRLWLIDDAGRQVDLGTGTVLPLGVDDGSAPDVEFITHEFAQELQAVDAGSGDLLWATEHNGWQPYSSILVGGVLYGSTSDTLHAIDARTGATLWDADVVAYNSWSAQPVTDGRQLLLLAREDSEPVLVALDLRTGERLWSAPMPADAELLVAQRHQLFVLRADRLAPVT
nr:PQQ-binding-like beta-propeller repeat protein [Cellulomonas denverensis]